MTSIKKPPSTTGISGLETPTAPTTGSAGATEGPSFRDRVGGAQGATAAGGTNAVQAASLDPTQTTIAELRAGRINGDQAVQNLTDSAMKKNNVPPAFRAAVETQVRDLLQRDPVVRELMKNIGATLQEQSSDK